MLRHAPLPSHSDHPAELGFKGWGRGLFKVGEGNLLRLCRSHRQIPIPHLPKMRGHTVEAVEQPMRDNPVDNLFITGFISIFHILP